MASLACECVQMDVFLSVLNFFFFFFFYSFFYHVCGKVDVHFLFLQDSEAVTLSISATVAQKVCFCVTATSFLIGEESHFIPSTGCIINFTATFMNGNNHFKMCFYSLRWAVKSLHCPFNVISLIYVTLALISA